MITFQRTMPESDFTSEDSLDRSDQPESDPSVDELLNASELQTVLDMLAVMEAAEELSQLQALTEAQKRQVWEATPDLLKQKLWRLRAATEDHGQERSIEEALEDAANESEDDIEDLGQDLDLADPSYAAADASSTRTVQLNLAIPLNQRASPNSGQLIPELGDRVVLRAHPKLTASEMKAVWQLKGIQGNNAEVYDTALGTRIYPLAWVAVYSKGQPESEPSELEQNELDDEFF